jgi:APA family basic amino acid/polyamine antiporter
VSANSFSTLTRPSEKSDLLRQLGVVSATALVISNMIGQGIFTATGYLAADLGSPILILLIWVVGAMCALAGAFCYSELGLNFPRSGGEYVYLSEAYGPTWGFMTGWISFFAGFSAPIAAAALAFSDYLGYFFPAIRQANPQFVLGHGSWAWHFGGAQLVACGLVTVFTILNFFGVQRVAKVQNLLTALKVAMICVFLILAFTAGHGNWGNFTGSTVRETTRPLTAQFAISLFWIYVAYSGWNAATYVAEELRQPARTLPLALAAGTGIVAVLFVALNVAYIYAVPLRDMKGVLAVGSLASARLFGPEIAGLFSALMALGLMSTVNAMVTVGPRVYYAMAKNRAFLPSAARVHRRWHTPVIAIVAQGLCTVIMALAPFRQLISYIGLLLNFFAVMAVASIFLFRRRPGWQKLPIVSFLYPAIPVLFVAVGLWMTYQGVRQQPIVAGAAALTVAAGALFYQTRINNHRQS